MVIFYCFNVLKKCKRPTISGPERAIIPYSSSSTRSESFSVNSFVAGKYLFLGDFSGLILLGFMKLNIQD